MAGAQSAQTVAEQHRDARVDCVTGDDVRVVCPVDEVHGIHRVLPRELKDVPTTVAKSAVTYSTALLSWRGHSVGILDDQLLFYSLKRSLA
jgi:chemotaxis-related protein WspD